MAIHEFHPAEDLPVLIGPELRSDFDFSNLSVESILTFLREHDLPLAETASVELEIEEPESIELDAIEPLETGLDFDPTIESYFTNKEAQQYLVDQLSPIEVRRIMFEALHFKTRPERDAYFISQAIANIRENVRLQKEKDESDPILLDIRSRVDSMAAEPSFPTFPEAS